MVGPCKVVAGETRLLHSRGQPRRAVCQRSRRRGGWVGDRDRSPPPELAGCYPERPIDRHDAGLCAGVAAGVIN